MRRTWIAMGLVLAGCGQDAPPPPPDTTGSSSCAVPTSPGALSVCGQVLPMANNVYPHTVILAWATTDAGKLYGYKLGQADVQDGHFQLSLSAPPPSEVFNQHGVAIGVVLPSNPHGLYPQYEMGMPDGRIADFRPYLPIQDELVILNLRSAGANFPAGYSCATLEDPNFLPRSCSAWIVDSSFPPVF